MWKISENNFGLPSSLIESSKKILAEEIKVRSFVKIVSGENKGKVGVVEEIRPHPVSGGQRSYRVVYEGGHSIIEKKSLRVFKESEETISESEDNVKYVKNKIAAWHEHHDSMVKKLPDDHPDYKMHKNSRDNYKHLLDKLNESVELEELSKNTLQSYANKADKEFDGDMKKATKLYDKHRSNPDSEAKEKADKILDKVDRRSATLGKLKKKGIYAEEFETFTDAELDTLEELSKATMKDYVSTAKKDVDMKNHEADHHENEGKHQKKVGDVLTSMSSSKETTDAAYKRYSKATDSQIKAAEIRTKSDKRSRYILKAIKKV